MKIGLLLLFGLVCFLVFVNECLAIDTALILGSPPSIKHGENFEVIAIYKNETNICGATCKISGGWLLNEVYLSEGIDCDYSTTLFADVEAKNYFFTVTCEKEGYETKYERFEINVEKANSQISISVTPENPYAGDMIKVTAYYNDYYGISISGTCKAKLKDSSGTLESKTMGFSSYYNYYSVYFTAPEEEGNYKIEVTCESDNYETKKSSKSFSVTKINAQLSVDYKKPVYFGKTIWVNARYTSNGVLITDGTCNLKLSKGNKIIKEEEKISSYSWNLRIPFEEGPFKMEITCNSKKYKTIFYSSFIYPRERPTSLNVIYPFKTNFYPKETIQVKVMYKDILNMNPVENSNCYTEIDGKKTTLKFNNGYYESYLENFSIGDYELKITCSKEFFTKSEKIIKIHVYPIPLTIEWSDFKNEYESGEPINLNIRVLDKFGSVSDVNCRARIEYYKGLNRLYKTEDSDMKFENEYYKLTLTDTKEPKKIRIMVSCEGDIYDKKLEVFETRIRMLSKEMEEKVATILSITTIILIGLIFFIRKKLKLI